MLNDALELLPRCLGTFPHASASEMHTQFLHTVTSLGTSPMLLNRVCKK
jgi:hypothetical protein